MKKLHLRSKLRRQRTVLSEKFRGFSTKKYHIRVKKVIRMVLILTLIGGAIWYHPRSKSLILKVFKKASKLNILNRVEDLSNSKDSNISHLNGTQSSYIRVLFNTLLISLILAMIHNINADVCDSHVVSSDTNQKNTLTYILRYGKNLTVTDADSTALPMVIGILGVFIPGLSRILNS